MLRFHSRSKACGLLLLTLVGAMGLDAASCLAHDFKLTPSVIPDKTSGRLQMLVQPKPLTGSDVVSLEWMAYDSDGTPLIVYDADPPTPADPYTPDTAVGGTSGPPYFTDTKYATTAPPGHDVYFTVFAQGLDTDRIKSIGPISPSKVWLSPSKLGPVRPKLRIDLDDINKFAGGREATISFDISNAANGQTVGVAYTGFYHDAGKRVRLPDTPKIVKARIPITDNKVDPLKCKIDLSKVAAANYPVRVKIHAWIEGFDDDDDVGQDHISIRVREP